MVKTKFKPLKCEGSYFVLALHQECLDDEDFCKKMVLEKKVAAIPISAFYHDSYDPKIIRFCFAKNDETLAQANENLLN